MMVNIGFATPTTKIAVDPTTSTTNPAETMYITINITDAVDVTGFELKLTWDLAATEFPPEVTEGTFLSQEGLYATTFITLSNFLFGYTLIGGYIKPSPGVPTPQVSGSGDLATVTFKIKPTWSGSSPLHIFDSKLWDRNDVLLPHTTADGFFHTTKPFVSFFWTPSAPIAGEVVTFNASASYDPDNAISDPTPGPLANFTWDFGDGSLPVSSGMSPVITHTFANYRFEAYMVKLTVTDDDNETISLTKPLRIWRDLAIVSVWTSIDWWDNTHFDLFHGQLNPYDAYPDVDILVTVTNLGTVKETYSVVVYADLDTSTIGDEFVLYPYKRTKTLAAGAGSGWDLWYLWDIRDSSSPFSGPVWNINPLVKNPGQYTITAILTSTYDQDPTNNVMQSPLYIHARAEPSGVSVSPRNYKISRNGPNFALYGYVGNVEKSGANIDGIWARLAFDIIDQMGTVKTLRTQAVYLENGQNSPKMSVIWAGLTLADVGSYTVVAYSEFGWNGVDFPFVGLEPKTTTVDILP